MVSYRAYASTEPRRTSGRKKAATRVLFVTPIAFFDEAIFPVRDGLERVRPNRFWKDTFRKVIDRCLLERFACPVPFHGIRTRFLGNIATPSMSASPIKVVGDKDAGRMPSAAGRANEEPFTASANPLRLSLLSEKVTLLRGSLTTPGPMTQAERFGGSPTPAAARGPEIGKGGSR